ncbi:MAG: YicC family protein [Puniceicoccaceae bacterium]|nr:MAG: YicC family protein [Puniceicoccaceae bacterium]
MNSMTGFGRASGTVGTVAFEVVLSSVNRRSLELSFSLPREWQPLEAELIPIIRRHAARGRIQIAVEVRRPEGAAAGWDDAAVAAAWERLSTLAARLGIPMDAGADTLLSLLEIAAKESALPPAENAAKAVRETLLQALDAFRASRIREGQALAADLSARIDKVRGWIDEIRSRAPEMPSRYRDLLLIRLRQAGLDLDPEDERVLKEIALFADRCDISEELTRLGSHLAQLAELLQETQEPVGRRLDFLLQEISREVHTTGAKSNDLEISKLVLEAKNELERIREQVQNIE